MSNDPETRRASSSTPQPDSAWDLSGRNSPSAIHVLYRYRRVAQARSIELGISSEHSENGIFAILYCPHTATSNHHCTHSSTTKLVCVIRNTTTTRRPRGLHPDSSTDQNIFSHTYLSSSVQLTAILSANPAPIPSVLPAHAATTSSSTDRHAPVRTAS